MRLGKEGSRLLKAFNDDGSTKGPDEPLVGIAFVRIDGEQEPNRNNSFSKDLYRVPL